MAFKFNIVLLSLFLIVFTAGRDIAASTADEARVESILQKEFQALDDLKHELVSSGRGELCKPFRIRVRLSLLLLESFYMYYPCEECRSRITDLIGLMDLSGAYRDCEEALKGIGDRQSQKDRVQVLEDRKNKAFQALMTRLREFDSQGYWESYRSFLKKARYSKEGAMWKGEPYFWDYERMGYGRAGDFKDRVRIVLNHLLMRLGTSMKKDLDAMKPEEFHAVRIEARNLRDFLQIFRETVPVQESLMKKLNAAISLLGDYNDRVTANSLVCSRRSGADEGTALKDRCIEEVHGLRALARDLYLSLNDTFFIPFAEGLIELPDAIALYRDELYLADALERVIYVFDAVNLTMKEEIRCLKEGRGELQGIALDRDGSLYVVDEGRRNVTILRRQGGYERWSTFPAEGIMKSPRGIALTDDRIYVTDSKIRKVNVFGRDLTLLKEIPVFQSSLTQIECILPVDHNRFIVASEYRHLVACIDESGMELYRAGEWIFPGQPEQIVFSPDSQMKRFLVLNEMIGAVDEFSTDDGRFIRELYLGTGSGRGHLKNPDGMCLFNEQGRSKLFIADQLNKRIVKIDFLMLEELSELEPLTDWELRRHLASFCEWISGVHFKTEGFSPDDREALDALAGYIAAGKRKTGFGLYWKDIRKEFVQSLAIDIVDEKASKYWFGELDRRISALEIP
ncbi:MAG: CHAD domain-containing protein [Candidatus Xenobiia bacterium LiM19]